MGGEGGDGFSERFAYEHCCEGQTLLRAELAEANIRAGEAEQFLMYAPEEQIRRHRRRVHLMAGPRWPRDRSTSMPRIEGGKSVWDPPADLLESDQVWELPLGSLVRWVGDRSEGGLRRRVGALKRVSAWEPAIGEGDFYWLVRTGFGD